jgi:hypothetical protein
VRFLVHWGAGVGVARKKLRSKLWPGVKPAAMVPGPDEPVPSVAGEPAVAHSVADVLATMPEGAAEATAAALAELEGAAPAPAPARKQRGKRPPGKLHLEAGSPELRTPAGVATLSSAIGKGGSAGLRSGSVIKDKVAAALETQELMNATFTLDQVLCSMGVPRSRIMLEAAAEGRDDAHRFMLTEAQVEHRRACVHHLSLRGFSRSVIAAHLGISGECVYADTLWLNAQMKDELSRTDIPVLIGRSIAFWEELKKSGFALAHNPLNEARTQVAGFALAAKAEEAKFEFLQKVGLFKIFRPEEPLNAIDTGRGTATTGESQIAQFMALVALPAPAPAAPVAEPPATGSPAAEPPPEPKVIEVREDPAVALFAEPVPTLLQSEPPPVAETTTEPPDEPTSA